MILTYTNNAVTASGANISHYRHMRNLSVYSERLFANKHPPVNNNNKLGRKLADQSGDDREISFLFQRLSVLIQRYNAILLHDCFVKEEEE